MIYSKSSEYAIRALTYLADRPGPERAMISGISSETGIPGAYLAKIFQLLVKNDILTSERGAKGGFAFKRAPETISLFEVVEAVEDTTSLSRDCVMGLDRCSSVNACPLHVVWSKAKENLLENLKRLTVKQIIKKIEKKEFRKLKRSRLQMTLRKRKMENAV